MSVAVALERRPAQDNLFPLKLTSFEDYMRLDDRPKYPMSFFIEIKLSGEVDREAMEAALQSALQRHPLLTAHVHAPLFGTPQWRDAQDCPEINWFDGDPVLPGVGERFIDLRNSSGLRIWAGASAEECRMVLQFHHAVTDGLGSMQFIGDLLAYYGRMIGRGGELPELAPVDRMILRKRGQLWEPGHEHQRLVSHVLWWGTHLARHYPAGLRFPDNQETSFNDPFVTRVLDGKTTRKLKQQAAKNQVSPHELYTLAMFQLLREWNLQHGASDGSTVRVGIPFTLRTLTHEKSPAANVLSYMFLSRKSRDIANPEKTLSYIHRTSKEILNAGDQALLIWGMGIVRKFPRLLRAYTSAPARFATAMLSNVGDVKRALRNRFPMDRGRCVAGNLVLEHLLGASPTRPGTHLSLALGHYAGKLFMNLNCDPWQCARSDAEKMADQYVDLLHQLVPSEAETTTAETSSDQPVGYKD